MLRLTWIVLLNSLAFAVHAQYRNTFWYFGANCGLRFDPVQPTVLFDNGSATTMACGSISDLNGMLILYASREEVRNGQHANLANGSGLSFEDTSCPLVLPWPAHPDQYFVLGWNATESPMVREQLLQLVDMSTNNGMGSVIQKNVVLSDSVGNGIVGIPHCNGSDVWIVMHERGSDRFLSYLLSTNGIAVQPIVSAVGPVHPYWTAEWDHLKANDQGTQLAYCYTGDLGRQLDLYGFDPCSGAVTDQVVIGHDSGLRAAEIAPGGNLLYSVVNSCVSGDTSLLYQYDISSGDSALIAASRSVVGSGPIVQNCDESLFLLSAAPNGKVYVAIRDTTCLGVVNSPDTPGIGCDFVYCGQDLGGRRNNVSLPHQVKFPPDINSIAEEPPEPPPLRIHPTPASDGFWLDTEGARHLELLDLQGRMVQSARVNGTGPHWLPREGLGAGTYLLRAFSARGEVIGYGRVVFR